MDDVYLFQPLVGSDGAKFYVVSTSTLIVLFLFNFLIL
jgi:hypothetical protein